MRKFITKANLIVLILAIISLASSFVLRQLISSWDFVYKLLFGNYNQYLFAGKIMMFCIGLSSLIYFMLAIIQFLPVLFKKSKVTNLKILYLIGGFIGIIAVFPFALKSLQVMNDLLNINNLSNYEYLLRYYKIFDDSCLILFIFELITFLIVKYYRPNRRY